MGAPDGAPPGGLRDATHRLLASALAIGRTRLELATIELEAERLHLAHLLIAASITLFLLFLGLLLAAGWIVAVCAPADRPLALALLTALFLGAAAAGAWHWRRVALRKPPLLEATLAALQEDLAAATPSGATR